jgi:hypothetical protein
LIRFKDSEIELDEELEKFSVIASAPELFPDFVQLKGVKLICGLLNHENVGIAFPSYNYNDQISWEM